MTKSINIAIIAMAVMAGLLSTSPLASGAGGAARISDLSALTYLLFVIPVVLLATSISALYGRAVHEHWWHIGAGFIGLVLALLSTFAAKMLLSRMGDFEFINFAGYALPLAYTAILFLSIYQGVLAWALRLNSNIRKKYAAAIDTSSETSLLKDQTAMVQLLETYVGSTQYRERWTQRLSFLAREVPLFKFHPFAFSLGSSWWFYRKMYRLGALVLIAELVVGMTAGIGFSFAFTSDSNFDAVI